MLSSGQRPWSKQFSLRVPCPNWGDTNCRKQRKNEESSRVHAHHRIIHVPKWWCEFSLLVNEPKEGAKQICTAIQASYKRWPVPSEQIIIICLRLGQDQLHYPSMLCWANQEISKIILLSTWIEENTLEFRRKCVWESKHVCITASACLNDTRWSQIKGIICSCQLTCQIMSNFITILVAICFRLWTSTQSTPCESIARNSWT